MDDSDFRRLRWQCRRGMLELDLLLERFMEVGYPQLDADECVLFAQFLESPDPVLHDWFMGHSVPEDPRVRALVARIRDSGHPPGQEQLR